MSKRAILQCADAGPVESLAVMLRSVGYDCHLPGAALRAELRAAFGRRGLVLDVDSLAKSMGYEKPFPMSEATPGMMRDADLYVDVKAHRVYGDVVARWPNLAGKVLYYRIQGGRPEHVIKSDGEDCGDEANPPCPVLTPNQWYAEESVPHCDDGWCGDEILHPWAGRAYACWPPFYRFDEYHDRHGRPASGAYDPPVCLIHSASGWGYGRLFDNFRAMGVRILGAGSPDGLVQHRDVPALLARSLCMVHLKSSDAPGYSLYESLAAACPLVCTRRLIWRSRMQDLLVPGETCLVFDRETHEGLTDDDVASCTAEVAGHLERLRDPAENRRLGEAGRARLRDVMWSEGKPENVASLRAFMERHYG